MALMKFRKCTLFFCKAKRFWITNDLTKLLQKRRKKQFHEYFCRKEKKSRSRTRYFHEIFVERKRKAAEYYHALCFHDFFLGWTIFSQSFWRAKEKEEKIIWRVFCFHEISSEMEKNLIEELSFHGFFCRKKVCLQLNYGTWMKHNTFNEERSYHSVVTNVTFLFGTYEYLP